LSQQLFTYGDVAL